MIRLQCPICQTIVKIGADTVAKHPVVRCAKCQGLVPVQQCIVEEKPAIAPKRRTPKGRRYSSSQVPLILGIAAGLLVLAGAGFALYWFNRTPSAGQIAGMKKENIDNLSLDALYERHDTVNETMVQTLESIYTRKDAERVETKVNDLFEEIHRIDAAISKHESKLTQQERDKNRMARMPKMLASLKRLNVVRAHHDANPELAQFFADMAASRHVRRPAASPNSDRPVVEKNNYVPPEYARKGKYLSDAVDKMKDLVFSLHGVHTPAQLVKYLDKLETYKKDVEQLFRESNSNNFEFDNTYIPNFDGLQSHCAVMRMEVKRLGERFVQDEAMRKVLTEHADRIKNCALDRQLYSSLMVMLPTPETFIDFKYDPSASNTRKTSNRNWNPSDEEKNVRAMTGFELIAWLKTAPSYKKSELLKQMLLETVSSDRKEIFLRVAGMFMEDSDIHNKEDVFKLFRKWASTQEDKERVGVHAEEFLKNHSTRETVMRWFGENKVISASKEVAIYLKESRFEKNDAAETLIAMGSGAEPAVIPYLTALEPKTRHLAIEVLARIGTRQCMPALRKLNTDQHVSLAAKQALVIIDKRHPEK